MLLSYVPQLRPAEGELTYVDLLGRACLASDLMPKIDRHYLLHESGCPGEVGEACSCGMVVVFVGPAAMVMVDSHYACRTDLIN
ncbi:hypothetical protein [Stenotrophomonas sp. AR026]|uniref:hypothetical protein n=1 Tax=Stenotrophomonas sp. AR026 TaxID=3398462 RepID=UPI003BAE47F0